jgi:hypothetical protein
MDDTYIEIKGYKTINDEKKWNQFPKKLVILYKKDLEEVFQYIHNKYGKDFIKMYEKI